jgi:hypothetical protein
MFRLAPCKKFLFFLGRWVGIRYDFKDKYLCSVVVVFGRKLKTKNYNNRTRELKTKYI